MKAEEFSHERKSIDVEKRIPYSVLTINKRGRAFLLSPENLFAFIPHPPPFFLSLSPSARQLEVTGIVTLHVTGFSKLQEH